MRPINPTTGKPWKRGEMRADGMIFLTMHSGCKGGIRWVTARQFDEHVQRQRDYSRRAYWSNPEKFREKARQEIAENREAHSERVKAWKKNNPERVRRSHQEWRKKNQDSIRRRGLEWGRRARENPLFRLRQNVRTRLGNAIRRGGFSKKSETAHMIGCSWDFLKTYIEQRFSPGMTWENYGRWHIDHHIPLKTARTTAELEKLSRYTNLVPLWEEENLSKGSKIVRQQELFAA